MESVNARYSFQMRLLHWSIAVLVLGNFGLGLVLAWLEGTAPETGYSFHKSLGAITFVLVILRLLRRAVFEAPMPLLPTPAWQRIAARVTHALLYALMVAIPVSGYLSSSAAGYPTSVFGWFTIPPVLDENRIVYGRLKELHALFNHLAMILIAVHVAAVAWDRWVRGHDNLARMLLTSPQLPTSSGRETSNARTMVSPR